MAVVQLIKKKVDGPAEEWKETNAKRLEEEGRRDETTLFS
jgi:hypothetical protein